LNTLDAKTLRDSSSRYSYAVQALKKERQSVLNIIANFTGGMLFMLITLSVIYLTLFLMSLPEGTAQPPKFAEPSREELAAAHRFHGVNSSYEGVDHKWYFINKDGVECKLFSYKQRR